MCHVERHLQGADTPPVPQPPLHRAFKQEAGETPNPFLLPAGSTCLWALQEGIRSCTLSARGITWVNAHISAHTCALSYVSARHSRGNARTHAHPNPLEPKGECGNGSRPKEPHQGEGIATIVNYRLHRCVCSIWKRKAVSSFCFSHLQTLPYALAYAARRP